MTGIRPIAVCGLTIAGALTAACGDPLHLGSDVLWSTDHEDGLGAWSEEGVGGVDVDAFALAELSDEQSRSGQHAAVLSVNPTGNDTVAVLRRSGLPDAAYYSAWLMVPDQYWTRASWTIWNLQTSNDAPDPSRNGLSLNLRALPGGGYVLYVFHHDVRYLQAPIADPAPVVQPGQWFHLSVFLRAASDDTGQMTVWFDGEQTYDIRYRPTAGRGPLHWSVGSVASEIFNGPARLYVDDAVVSLTRVNPGVDVRSF